MTSLDGEKPQVSTGGDAFPVSTYDSFYPGMSLLDYFAGRVAPYCMQSVVGTDPHKITEEVRVAAVAAYRMAQALVVESEQLQQVDKPARDIYQSYANPPPTCSHGYTHCSICEGFPSGEKSDDQ